MSADMRETGAGERAEAGSPIGRWSVSTVFWLGVAYLITGVAWLRSGGDSSLRPTDPYLAILEILIVLAAPLMLVMMAAVHEHAPPDAKPYSLAALEFMTLLTGLTCSIHFVQLTVIRRIDPTAIAGTITSVQWRWPSVIFALDLLAWDVFFGLAMLFAAPVLEGADGRPRSGARCR